MSSARMLLTLAFFLLTCDYCLGSKTVRIPVYHNASKQAPYHFDVSKPMPTYMEPQPAIPRTLIETMSTPLQLPDGQKLTFSLANSLFRRSLLLNTLKNNNTDKSFTVIMPEDGAFNVLGSDTLDHLLKNRRKILLNNIIEGKVNISAVIKRKATPVCSLAGTVVISSLGNGKTFTVNGARILSIRPASDGLILVTDRVIYPSPAKSVAKALTTLSALKSIVEKKRVARSILPSDEAPYTVFEPSNQAFATLPLEKLMDLTFLHEIYWYHTVVGAYNSSRLTPGLELTTLRGNIINVQHTTEGDILVNNIPLSGEERIIGDGVIHEIDRVLFVPEISRLPPKVDNITALLVAEPVNELYELARLFNATRFLQWMKRAGMPYILQTEALKKGCTLFLPTNSALYSMSPTLRSFILENVQRLQEFILFHLSPRPFHYYSTQNDALLPTLMPGKTIRCNIYAKSKQQVDVLSVSGCKVRAIRLLAGDYNVMVVVIEGTMSPPTSSLVLAVSKSPLLTNFSKILEIGADEISKEGAPYTLFAPSNSAFSKMNAQQYQELTSNKKLAREFVKRYLVKGCYYNIGLYDDQILTAEAGTSLNVQVTPDCVLISGFRVLYGDMSSTDGVLHIVGDFFPS